MLFSQCRQDDRSDIIKPVALTHPPPPPHPHPYSSSPSTVPYNKAPRPYGGCRREREHPPSQSPFAPFIPSPSSAFTPASSSTSPPPPPPPPVSYPSSTSSSSPPVLGPPQPSVYNTPINLYSTENACEVAMGQRRGLLESQGGPLPLQLNGWVVLSPANQTKDQLYILSTFDISPSFCSSLKCMIFFFHSYCCPNILFFCLYLSSVYNTSI